MKNPTSQQIAQIKEVKIFTSTNFHGNRKMVGQLPVNEFKTIVSKKVARAYNMLPDNSTLNPLDKARQLIRQSQQYKNTPYFKVLIEGTTNIYYASPIYGLNDYNKSIAFAKTPQTLKLMRIFNAIISK